MSTLHVRLHASHSASASHTLSFSFSFTPQFGFGSRLYFSLSSRAFKFNILTAYVPALTSVSFFTLQFILHRRSASACTDSCHRLAHQLASFFACDNFSSTSVIALSTTLKLLYTQRASPGPTASTPDLRLGFSPSRLQLLWVPVNVHIAFSVSRQRVHVSAEHTST